MGLHLLADTGRGVKQCAALRLLGGEDLQLVSVTAAELSPDAIAKLARTRS